MAVTPTSNLPLATIPKGRHDTLTVALTTFPVAPGLPRLCLRVWAPSKDDPAKTYATREGFTLTPPEARQLAGVLAEALAVLDRTDDGVPSEADLAAIRAEAAGPNVVALPAASVAERPEATA